MANYRTRAATALSKNANTLLSLVVLTLVDTKKGFSVIASFTNQAGDVVTFADANGKVKAYVNSDDFVTEAGKFLLLAENCKFDLVNTEFLAPKPFTGDIIAKANRDLVKIEADKLTEAAKVVRLTQELGLLAGQMPVPEALIGEKTEQKNVIVGYVEYLNSERTRIRAALGLGN
jgi:hypothetical protein